MFSGVAEVVNLLCYYVLLLLSRIKVIRPENESGRLNGRNINQHGAERGVSTANSRTITGTTKVTKNENVKIVKKKPDLASIYGPIPPQGSTIFQEFKFVIIATPTKTDKSSDQLSTPFSRSYLIKQVYGGKGCVLIPNLDNPYWHTLNIFIIAETNVISHTYLKALASGKNLISHEWIVECCRQNKIVPYEKYRLPAGRSMLDKKIIAWHGHKDVFSLWQIAIQSESDTSEEYKFWKSLLGLCGARIVAIGEIAGQPEVHIHFTVPKKGLLMIDNCYSREEIRQLKELSLTLYTTDWIIECLIRGEIVEAKKHSNFALGRKTYRQQ